MPHSALNNVLLPVFGFPTSAIVSVEVAVAVLTGEDEWFVISTDT
jgi:hypothetical protein